ncbi:MAG: hypothetical protein NDI69_03605 [Bacteriovoracaceae bacterium]|nr:hypothetical protein [Bacteriovoracaceae bacterium]
MSLPVYQHFNLKTASLEEVNSLLTRDLNLKHPVVINLKSLDLDEQRETIGLIENYFFSNNLSFKFPYPLYLISDHEASIAKMPLIKETQALPKFYNSRDGKMNVKESHLVGKNKLLQQEVKNSDASVSLKDLENYASAHRIIFELEEEKRFCRSILNRLLKVGKNG